MSGDDENRRVLHSTSAALFSQLWRVGLTFLTHFLLRRLVSPEDWGAWTWAEPIFLVLTAFRDMGLPAHVIRVKPRPFGNLLAVEAGFGAALVALTWLGAPWLAGFNADGGPELASLLRLLSLYVFFDGLAKVPRVWFESELALRETVFAELFRNACYSGMALYLAASDAGVWSMAIAFVFAQGAFAALLWLRARGRIPLVWLRGRTLALLRESAPLAVIWILVLLTTYVDPLLLGARFPREVVGTYGFAYYVAFLVSTVMVEPVSRVLYPALVRALAERERVFEAYRLATVLLLSLEVPVALCLFVNAELVLGILGGRENNWIELGAAAFLRVLCFAPLVDPLGRFGGDVLVAHHRDRVWIVGPGNHARVVRRGRPLRDRAPGRPSAWPTSISCRGEA